MKAGVKWIQSMEFAGFNDKNSENNIVKSEGPTPKHLFLQSIAGCTAIDVIGILEKMRVDKPAGFKAEVEGDLTEDHPKVFKNFKMIYIVEGDIDPEKLKRAVNLSQEHYCGISKMAKMIAELSITVILNGKTIL